LCRRLLLRHFHEVDISPFYWLGPLAAAAAGLAAAEALIWAFGPDRGFGIAIPATLAGLVVYGLALLAWVRLSGESLLPQGFVSGEAAAEAAAE
jgi:asparagine N-glycosylation enzyme membrane subunit Stt3